jgi:hypothetical protein
VPCLVGTKCTGVGQGEGGGKHGTGSDGIAREIRSSAGGDNALETLHVHRANMVLLGKDTRV